MPRLNVRALAEVLNLPAYAQMRILHEQKYPRQQPQTFKIPYYAPALRVIRDFFSSGNDPQTIHAALPLVRASIGLESRRAHNVRVLHSFLASPHAQRTMAPMPNRNYALTVASVDIRLSYDLTATENGQPKFLFFNLRAEPLDAELARVTIEIAHWVMTALGAQVEMNALEYLDLTNGRRHTFTRARAKTLRNVSQNITVIKALWDSI